MLDFGGIVSVVRRGRVARFVAVCAVAVVAVVVGVGLSGSVAYADGGGQAASDDSGVRGYAVGVLRALAEDDGGAWARYWRVRARCDAAMGEYARQEERDDVGALDRALVGLVGALCGGLEARLGVSVGDEVALSGEGRTVGLVVNEPGVAVGYALVTGIWNRDVFLVDPLGRVAHRWRTDRAFGDARLLANGNLLAMEVSEGTTDAIYEVGPDGKAVWRYELEGLHHDFLMMPNGNVLLLYRERKTKEEAVAAGANPEFVHESGLVYDKLAEVRPIGASGGEVVWEWSVWDHLVQDFDPSKPNYGVVADHPERVDLNFLLESISNFRLRRPGDWLHVNAIDYNAELDQVMISPRNFSEVWVVDHSATTEEARGHSGGNSGLGGGLVYRWGNPRAYGRGDADDQRLFWQHHTNWVAPGLPGAGNILVFNNGYEFHGGERFYSTVDEIAPPVDGFGYARDAGGAYGPDMPVWSYATEELSDFYAPILSGAQRLPNGNTLVTEGTAGTVFQVAPDGRVVWEYVSPVNMRAHLRQGERAPAWGSFPAQIAGAPMLTNAVYRAAWHSPDHPGLRALDLAPDGLVEELPDEYDDAREGALAGEFGERLADSDFDLYLDEGQDDGGNERKRRLIYFREECVAGDVEAKFLLNVFPSDVGDLPDDRRGHGFVSLDFEFDGLYGKVADGWCLAVADLPGYGIERVRAGQFTEDGAVWQVEVELE